MVMLMSPVYIGIWRNWSALNKTELVELTSRAVTDIIVRDGQLEIIINENNSPLAQLWIEVETFDPKNDMYINKEFSQNWNFGTNSNQIISLRTQFDPKMMVNGRQFDFTFNLGRGKGTIKISARLYQYNENPGSALVFWIQKPKFDLPSEKWTFGG